LWPKAATYSLKLLQYLSVYEIDLDSVPTGQSHALITIMILDMAVLKGTALWSIIGLRPNLVESLEEYVSLVHVGAIPNPVPTAMETSCFMFGINWSIALLRK
jgi:hypothetical protein